MKEKFGVYGTLEKIEIFNDGNMQYAHVTFRKSAYAYLAINLLSNKEIIELIRPAPIHKQLKRPISNSNAPIKKLVDDCLVFIFEQCNIHDLATLSVTCERFRTVLKERIFNKSKNISFIGNNIPEGIITALRLVQSINPKHFKLSLRKKMLKSLDPIFYECEIDFDQTDRILDMEVSYFNQYGNSFEPIKNLFHKLIIRIDTEIPGTVLSSTNIFKFVRVLTIIGMTTLKTLPFIETLNWVPELEVMSFENLLFGPNHKFNKYYETSPKMRRFEFSGCQYISDKSFLLDIINKPDKRCVEFNRNGIEFQASELGSKDEMFEVSISKYYK